MSALKAVLALCIIFYLANQVSSLKCYRCASTSDEDCGKNPKKSEYETTCPGAMNVNSDSTFSDLKGSSPLSALVNISRSLASEHSKASKSLYDPECLKFTGNVGNIKNVIRMCIIKALTDDKIKESVSEFGMTDMTINRCDSDLCNSSSTLSIGFLSFASSLLLIFFSKL